MYTYNSDHKVLEIDDLYSEETWNTSKESDLKVDLVNAEYLLREKQEPEYEEGLFDDIGDL